jgi:type II secretory pathway pseudopilin PulG
MSPRADARAGVVLLEVLVALAILGASGAALAALAVGTNDAVLHARTRDDDVRRASALLEAVALWPREDLDRHLGRRPQGEWALEVRHPTANLYLVALSDSGSSRPLLATSLFRATPRPAESIAHAP